MTGHADFGESLHNIFEDQRIRKHAKKVNISALSWFLSDVQSFDGDDLELKLNGLRWSRLFIGMKPSPYHPVRFLLGRGEEFVRGGKLRDLLSNPFGSDNLILSLPGMQAPYDTLPPNIVKCKSKLKLIPGDVIQIVESSKEHCHLLHRQLTCHMQ